MQCFGPCQGAIISAIYLALFYCCPLQCPTASNLKADFSISVRVQNLSPFATN